MAEPSKTEEMWRLSSYSEPDQACVEVLIADPVRVRDSRYEAGGEVRFVASAWGELTAALADSARS